MSHREADIASAEQPEQSWLGAGQPLLPRVNLLPPEIGERRRLRRVQALLAGVAVASLVVVVAVFLVARSGVSDARGELSHAQGEQAALQRRVDGYGYVRRVYALVDETHGKLRTAGGAEILWSRYLADLSLRIPSGVWLTKVTVSPSATTSAATSSGTQAGASPGGVAQIQFDGVALAHNDVATWLESIAKEKGWSDPYFSKSEKGHHQRPVGLQLLVDRDGDHAGSLRSLHRHGRRLT